MRTHLDIFSLKVSIYAVDQNNDDTLLLKTCYSDDVYQLVASQVDKLSNLAEEKDIKLLLFH